MDEAACVSCTTCACHGIHHRGSSPLPAVCGEPGATAAGGGAAGHPVHHRRRSRSRGVATGRRHLAAAGHTGCAVCAGGRAAGRATGTRHSCPAQVPPLVHPVPAPRARRATTPSVRCLCPRSGASPPPCAEENDARFPAEVVGCISQSVCAQLSRYHETVADGRVMKVRQQAHSEHARNRTCCHVHAAFRFSGPLEMPAPHSTSWRAMWGGPGKGGLGGAKDPVAELCVGG